MRIIQDSDPYLSIAREQPWGQRGEWPCRWITLPEVPEAPFVAAYRRRFELPRDAELRLHVTADERYELFLDGERIGRGSERGDSRNWFYETYALKLAAGPHALVARVWSLGIQAPTAQITLVHGFLCSAEGEFVNLVGTGASDWEAMRLGGYGFLSSGMAWGTGARLDMDGATYPWGVEAGQGEGWAPAKPLLPGVNGDLKSHYHANRAHLLKPATLPAMFEAPVPPGKIRHVEDFAVPRECVEAANHLAGEAAGWQALLKGAPLTLPAHTTRRVIVDLDDYYCVYPQLVTSGGRGAVVSLKWAEALFEKGGKVSGGGQSDAARKGDRDAVEGKRFLGVGSQFRPDGGEGRRFTTLWWETGRYLEIVVTTAEAPLILEALAFAETRYPLRQEGAIACDDPRWEGVRRLSLRVVQMCSHETYFDCPYYEQLQYVGDTRVQALVTYVLTRDARLPRKALRMFDSSRLVDRAMTNCCYPCNTTYIIPPFSVWYTLMVHDLALWRGDRAFMQALMPGVRTILEAVLARRSAEGLILAPIGWNYMDWTPEWKQTTKSSRNWGVPPDGEFGVNGLFQWQVVLALLRTAELEDWLGEPELAARQRRLAAELLPRVEKTFWDAARGLYAEDAAHEHYSEHSQCLAILAGALDEARVRGLAAKLRTEPGLARTTIYVSHYLFEAFQKAGVAEALFERMDMWYDLEKSGLRTTIEEPEPSRSDCHGWGAHPLYHFYATVLGIRPASMGFDTVDIRPQLGPLGHASGTLPHPKGDLRVDFTVADGRLTGSVELPPGVAGTLRFGSTAVELKAGTQQISAR